MFDVVPGQGYILIVVQALQCFSVYQYEWVNRVDRICDPGVKPFFPKNAIEKMADWAVQINFAYCFLSKLLRPRLNQRLPVGGSVMDYSSAN